MTIAQLPALRARIFQPVLQTEHPFAFTPFPKRFCVLSFGCGSAAPCLSVANSRRTSAQALEPPNNTTAPVRRKSAINDTNAVSLFVTFVFICGFPYVVVFEVALE
jgi:hypothetical protein